MSRTTHEDPRDPRTLILDTLRDARDAGLNNEDTARQVWLVLVGRGVLTDCLTWWGPTEVSPAHPHGIHTCSSVVGHTWRHNCKGCRSWRLPGQVDA